MSDKVFNPECKLSSYKSKNMNTASRKSQIGMGKKITIIEQDINRKVDSKMWKTHRQRANMWLRLTIILLMDKNSKLRVGPP